MRLAWALPLLAATACDAFRTVTGTQLITAQGRPYELVVVADQEQWNGALGDTLRAVLTAPVPYLNQREPLFDVQRVLPRGYTGMVAEHRNVLEIVEDASLPEVQAIVRYDVQSQPQIVITLQGPTQLALTDYLSEHRAELVQAIEQAERDRAIAATEAHFSAEVQSAVEQIFGVEMKVPNGYRVANKQSDFLWARYEYPQASQGFFVYSYPYEGAQSLSFASLLAARNRFAARIPGPSDGSYMTTSKVIDPAYRIFRLEGRVWFELRGFWDVEGDFMGGPFVSFTTVDTATNRVFTVDAYVYSPKLHKRNFVRGVEQLIHTIRFPAPAKE